MSILRNTLVYGDAAQLNIDIPISSLISIFIKCGKVPGFHSPAHVYMHTQCYNHASTQTHTQTHVSTCVHTFTHTHTRTRASFGGQRGQPAHPLPAWKVGKQTYQIGLSPPKDF